MQKICLTCAEFLILVVFLLNTLVRSNESLGLLGLDTEFQAINASRWLSNYSSIAIDEDVHTNVGGTADFQLNTANIHAKRSALTEPTGAEPKRESHFLCGLRPRP